MPQLVVALPVRNGAHLLDAWYAAVEGVADAVVALDDGSTDDTAARLEAHPLTATVLRNPVRPTYAGWDDAANRQRLVDACAPLRPDWILQLDADERLAPGDGAALRRTIDDGELDAQDAYLLRVLRMVELEDDPAGEHYDDDHVWVGRLFAWRPGLRLPDQRLHLVPLPEDVPGERWRRTTLRICHYGSHTAELRRARVAKYREADPTDAWGTAYPRLLAPPATTRVLAPRPPSLPVLPHEPWSHEAEDAARHPAGAPLLTAVVISRDDEDVIERAVGALVAQEVSAPVQVVVVTSGRDATAERVRRRFPDVEVVQLDHPALPGEARNAGLARARGRYVTFPGSHIVVTPGSLEARLQCHLAGWGMVTGTTRNGTLTVAGWASYFLDHSGGLPGRPSHALTVAPSYASYLTEAVRSIGGFPEDMRTAEDTVVNTTLFDLGYGAWRDQDVGMVHHSPCVDVATLLRHHHQRGRGLGAMILRQHERESGPLLDRRRLVNLGVRHVPGRLRRVNHNVWQYGGALRLRWLLVAPLAAAAVVAAWAGAWRELLRPRPGLQEELVQDRLHPRALVAGIRRRGGGRGPSAAAAPPTRVFVAAGHGGGDPGAEAEDLVEADLNAALAERLVARLREHGLAVGTDLDHGNPSLPDEVALAHRYGDVAYYLALHHNANRDPGPRGAETFARPGAAADWGRALHDAQVQALRVLDPDLPDRGVKDGTVGGAAKHLDRAPGLAAVLEPCFLTNADDRALCRDPRYVELLAEALCRAVVDHGRAHGTWHQVHRPAGPALPPVFSVVIPTRDRPELLAQAVGSVLAQSLTGTEVLVVDDGGVHPVGPHPDPRVRVLRNDTPAGPAAARNRGIDAATGRFLAFLDDDDLWTPDRLDLALVGLARAPVAVCWTRHLDRPEGSHRLLEGLLGHALLDDTTPGLGATALRRDVAPRFDERWLAVEDVVWWWRLAQEQPVTTVPRVGYLVRLHEGPRGLNTAERRVEENLALLREHEELFGSRRAAAAHRWLRVGVLAGQAGDHRTEVAAFARVVRLRPGPRAVARLVRSSLRAWPGRAQGDPCG